MDNRYFHDFSLLRVSSSARAFAALIKPLQPAQHCSTAHMQILPPAGQCFALTNSIRPHNVAQRTEPANNGRLQSG
jgi:hypothetical protein